MSVRPPTLREKRRYLLVLVEPAWTQIDQKDLYYAVSSAITSLWGDVMASSIMPAVVAAEERFVIIRCLRGTERELAIALSTITTCREVRIALRIITASGTIESLRERIRTMKPPVGEDSGSCECIFEKKPVQVLHCDGQKIDVIEKGFKNTNRLFLTREDLEEL
jgi:ribonuclease P/MRP protein subunit POP5